jgi:hypothetical protein
MKIKEYLEFKSEELEEKRIKRRAEEISQARLSQWL